MEPRWLRERREEGARGLQVLSWPDRAAHRFRFSDPAWFWPEGGAGIDGVQVEAWAPRGAVVEAIREGVSERAGEFLGRLARPEDPFLAWNLANFQAGYFVFVPEGATFDEPIRLKVRVDGDGGPKGRAVRNLVVVGAGARAHLEERVSVASGLANVVTELVVAQGASLEVRRLDEVRSGASMFAHVRAAIGRDAHIRQARLLASLGRLKHEASTNLDGRGSRSEDLALIISEGQGHADLRIVEGHYGPDSESRVTVRAIASDEGHAVFTGLLKVEEGAKKVRAYEEAKGLLRSKTSHIDLLPELEILNHDVQASHGAAVGPLDEEALFYLMSRGLSKGEAEAMLLHGFGAPILDLLPEAFRPLIPWAREVEP